MKEKKYRLPSKWRGWKVTSDNQATSRVGETCLPSFAFPGTSLRQHVLALHLPTPSLRFVRSSTSRRDLVVG